MSLDLIILLGSVILLAAISAARLGARLGLPSLLLFLGLGIAISELGVTFTDASLAHSLGFVALMVILAEGGFTTHWPEIKGALPAGLLLATFGVAVSVGAISCFCFFVLGLDLPTSMLIGAITSPTDAAAVFSVLRKVPLPGRIRSILEAESGFNDAPIVLLVTSGTALALGNAPEGGIPILILTVLGELVGGILLGLAVGWIGAQILKRVALPAIGLYPLAALGWAVLAYATGNVIHLSSFAAVYVASLVLGNSKLPHRHATRSFVEGLGWIAQIGVFVMLGMLADSFRLDFNTVMIGIAIGTFVTFVARPLSTVACAIWFKMPWREQAFVSWAGLRGAVPIIMATVPLAMGAPSSSSIFSYVFVFVVIFTLLQAPPLPWLARKLGISTGSDATELEFEFAPLDTIRADMLQVHVCEDSKLHGITIREIRLPKHSVISLIVRHDEPFTPALDDIIKSGDEILIVTSAEDRNRVERRFKELSNQGRLARWYQEDETV